MTPSLRRFAAALGWLAVCTLVADSAASRRPAHRRPRARHARRRPAKIHAPAKAAAHASPWVPNPAVNAKDSYLIVDATSGRELASDQPDELRHPASLTKLMTLYLTFSALDSGKLSLGDALPVSMNALNAPPTKMGMTPNGTVIVRDAVMGLVTRSANDAAVAAGRSAGRRRGQLRPHDDPEGAPARHVLDGVSAMPRACPTPSR